jgi:hypothetical protein
MLIAQGIRARCVGEAGGSAYELRIGREDLGYPLIGDLLRRNGLADKLLAYNRGKDSCSRMDGWQAPVGFNGQFVSMKRMMKKNKGSSQSAQTEGKAKAESQAKKLLASPYFFRDFLAAVEKVGLVGEQTNAIVVLIVAVSRLLRRPLNLFVRGRSASGKNWLVTRVLLLLPRGRVREISNASEQAWNYAQNYFQHRVVYLQEQSEAGASVHRLRLMISEGKLIRVVTQWTNGERITKKHVARGPVAAISTTTHSSIKIDELTRHLSAVIDESPEQTRRIVQAYTKNSPGLSPDELRVWQAVHRQIEQRADIEVVFGDWFDEIADHVFVGDVTVRRYYPTFVEACRTVCLIRSFQGDRQATDGKLTLDFTDFAVTALIFDRIFVQSLHGQAGSSLEVREAVKTISYRKQHAGARDLAEYLGISLDAAYARLAQAYKAGVILRANPPEEDNRKFYIAAPRPRFIPDPEELFSRLKKGPNDVRFVHPRTGKWIRYSREKSKK